MTTRRPVFEPVGPIDLILVKQVREPFRQLIALAQIGVVSQEALQRFKMWLVNQRRKQAHQTPGERCLVQQRSRWNFITSQHHSVQLPHETAGELHIHCGCDSASTLIVVLRVLSQSQLQPLSDAVALHQRNLILQGRQRITPHPGNDKAAQLIQSVAMNHHESSTERWCNRHSCFLD